MTNNQVQQLDFMEKFTEIDENLGVDSWLLSVDKNKFSQIHSPYRKYVSICEDRGGRFFFTQIYFSYHVRRADNSIFK